MLPCVAKRRRSRLEFHVQNARARGGGADVAGTQWNAHVAASMAYEVSLVQRIDVSDVVRVAVDAGKKILEIYHGEPDQWDVERKSDASPLTRADQEANRIICDALGKLGPHIPIISEENKQLDYDVRKKYQCCWCVDPLDGTKEFLRRNGQFTVNIALIHGNKVVMGVVHTPCQGRTHWATLHQGAFVQEEDGTVAPIHCAPFHLSDRGLVLVGSNSHGSVETEEYVSQFAEPKFTALGSSLKLMLVAEGKAHIYPRMAPTCEWDTAASQIIVEEAGGRVVQAGLCDNKGKALESWHDALSKEEPLTYNKENLLNPFFVVYGARQ